MNLHGGNPYWPLVDGLPLVVPSLERDESCEVLVLGAGITGALVSDQLSRAGFDVAVVDRRHVLRGSTAASTALLQYEIDVPLVNLAELIGAPGAARAYVLGVEAIAQIARAAEGISCGFASRESLYLAESDDDVEFLRREEKARRAAGIDAALVSRAELLERFGISAGSAIVSKAAAECDPYALGAGLLKRAADRGARIFDRTAVRTLSETEAGVTAVTDRGHTVRARHAVLCTGYEAEPFLPSGAVELRSTYAMISEPVSDPEKLWKNLALWWQHSEPYLYGRVVDDARVIVGGEDEPFVDAAARDALVDTKAIVLAAKLGEVVPGLRVEPAFAWCGTFASTPDALGYIGPLRPRSNVHAVLGFGGNGITYGAIGAKLMAKRLAGRPSPDEELFAIGRASASRA